MLVLWTEWRTLILFLVVMVLFRSAIADWNQVPTGSMKPTILEGDRVVVNKLAYDLKVPFTTWHLAEWAQPSRGEIVTFYSPADDNLLIKRVIGVPGDVISMRNNQLFINEEPATYSRLDDDIVSQLDAYQRRHHAFFFEHYENVTYPSGIPAIVTVVSKHHVESVGNLDGTEAVVIIGRRRAKHNRVACVF